MCTNRIIRLNISGDGSVFAQNSANFMQKASPSSTVPLMVQSLNWIYRGVYKFHVVGFGVLDDPRKTGDHTGSPLHSVFVNSAINSNLFIIL